MTSSSPHSHYAEDVPSWLEASPCCWHVFGCKTGSLVAGKGKKVDVPQLNVKSQRDTPEVSYFTFYPEQMKILYIFVTTFIFFYGPKYTHKGIPDVSAWRPTSFACTFKAELEERLIQESREKQIKLSAVNSAWLEFKCTSSLMIVGSWVS